MYLMSLKTVVSKNRYNIQKSKQVGRYVKSSYSLLLESARRGNTKTYPIIKLYIEIFLFRERERKPVERHNRKPPSFVLPRERERNEWDYCATRQGQRKNSERGSGNIQATELNLTFKNRFCCVGVERKGRSCSSDDLEW